ncbi:hypothetical protein [Desulfosporosinus nitroreducens]|uniref:hypothetical protein n=1 Tax=Desulfosporosinus nitroreducens TaxID=2018668 RepID=UPI00265D081B|nr:hypothetical protein [Desulfosporosinus nitroreducens]
MCFAGAYTGSWFEGLDQEKTLSQINYPSVYIKAATQYGKDGVLYAANSDEDAEKVHSLIKENEMTTKNLATIFILSIRKNLFR